MEKADDISSEVEDFEEALENHDEGCDVLKVQTEPDDFEALPLQTCHVRFLLFQPHNPRLHPPRLPCNNSSICYEPFHYYFKLNVFFYQICHKIPW